MSNNLCPSVSFSKHLNNLAISNIATKMFDSLLINAFESKNNLKILDAYHLANIALKDYQQTYDLFLNEVNIDHDFYEHCKCLNEVIDATGYDIKERQMFFEISSPFSSSQNSEALIAIYPEAVQQSKLYGDILDFCYNNSVNEIN
jgi:hypothetical protein